MPRDDHIREGQKAGKGVVVDDVRGMILEKERGLFLIDIDCEESDLAALERLHHGGSIDQGASARVDQENPLLHDLERRLVDQMIGRRHQWYMQGQDVGITEELLTRIDIGGKEGHLLVRIVIIGKDLAAESAEQTHDGGADATGSADTNRPVAKLESTEPLQIEIGAADTVVSLVNVTPQRQDQPDGELGDGIRRIRRNIGQGDPKFRRRLEIDLVKSSTAGGQKPGATRGKFLKHGPACHIVDKNQGRLMTCGHDRGVLVETGLQECELDRRTLGRLLQHVTLIAPGVEDSDFHS